MNYSNFIARVQACKTHRTAYPPALMEAVETLHFEHGIPAKTIAQQLQAEPEYQDKSLDSLHAAICRHIRRATLRRGHTPRRKPKTPKKACTTSP